MANNLDINYAVVAAFERSKQRERTGSAAHLFSVILMAVFFLVLMGGLAAGVSMYRSVAQIQSDTNALHLQAGLLANTVHMNDAASAVAEGQGPEGRALVLVQNLDSGTYEVRIYGYEGHVVQEYAIAGRDYNPLGATQLLESDTFEFAFDGNLVTFTTDKGTFDVAVRSAQGGDAA